MKKLIMLLLVVVEVFGMAIKFSTSSIDDVSYSTYDMNEFGGVDYTTTPTNVSETRAIDISNYLPEGSSLVKRNGWEFMYTNETKKGYKIYYHNIWALDGKYVIYVTYYDTEKSSWYGGFMGVDSIDEISGVFGFLKPGSTTSYVGNIALDSNMTDSYGFERGGRLFVFAMNHYVMFWSETTTNDDGSTTQRFYEADVKDYAYIPTVIIGIQSEKSTVTQKTATHEDYNMLTDSYKLQLEINPDEFDDSNAEFIDTEYNLKDFLLSENDTLLGFELDGDYGYLYEDSDKVYKADLYYQEVDLVLKIVINRKGYLEFSIKADEFTTSDIQKLKTISNIRAIYKKTTSGISTIEGMKFGCFYGADSYRDTLFVTGNKTCKNTDFHTVDPIDTTVEDWVPYTYFGDMSFHAIGSSTSAIIGYGVNSDSSLTIFKETVAGEPNVYFRTCSWDIETQSATLSDGTEFPWKSATLNDSVLPSAINLSCDTKGQIIQYDNGVFVNSKDGIYYINVSSSSAASAYEGVEVSYLIRNDLGTDISDANYVIYNNQLWIYRKDKDGNGRVYVCDRNRYTYNNSQLIYEWWALDNIPADKFYVFDNQLYFTNENGLYKFNDKFVDENHVSFPSVEVGVDYPTDFNTDLYFNDKLDDLILSPTSNVITLLKGANDPKSAYNEFLSTAYFTTSTQMVMTLDSNIVTVLGTNSITFNFKTIDEDYQAMLESVIGNGAYWSDGNKAYTLSYSSIDYGYDVMEDDDEDTVKYQFYIEFSITEDTTKDHTKEGLYLSTDTQFGLCGAYCDYIEDTDTYKMLDDCTYSGSTWYWTKDGEYEDLGSNTIFNRFKVSINGIEVTMSPVVSSALSNVSLVYFMAVSSYWLSKYNALSRLDYLKTATNIYFVPDSRRGGYTHVGYRTSKRESGYNTVARGSSMTFNDVDFNDFDFGVTEFGRTYSSKKKIKNFSFIQLKFYSNESKDSTLVACTFRYKYSKNNKGVK